MDKSGLGPLVFHARNRIGTARRKLGQGKRSHAPTLWEWRLSLRATPASLAPDPTAPRWDRPKCHRKRGVGISPRLSRFYFLIISSLCLPIPQPTSPVPVRVPVPVPSPWYRDPHGSGGRLAMSFAGNFTDVGAAVEVVAVAATTRPFLSVITLLIAVSFAQSLHRYVRLRHFPGPWLARWSRIPLIAWHLTGQVHLKYQELSEKYGRYLYVHPGPRLCVVCCVYSPK